LAQISSWSWEASAPNKDSEYISANQLRYDLIVVAITGRTIHFCVFFKPNLDLIHQIKAIFKYNLIIKPFYHFFNHQTLLFLLRMAN
ncbi:hypothetical protein, partial [Vibrio sp. CUB2]|uniref:hypothetical protein n=1 Tax=Vibrio sp. CUB2 TaxID=2315233 RepID=UPI001AD92CAA